MTEAVAANANAVYKKILIPIDNSQLCREGINWGIEMARAWGSSLIGNHVYAARLHDDRFRQLEAGLPARFQTPEEIKKQRNIHDKLIEQGLILISDSFLDVLAKRGEEANVKIERKLMEGIHFEQLAKDINSSDYDLVIMGAHGLGRVKVSLLGSVVGRLSRLITTDMLIVKDERSIRNGRILVAVDGSAYSYVALRKAIHLAKEFMCAIDVVAAFDPFYHYAAFNSIRYILSAQAEKVFKFEEQEELHNNIIDRGLKKVCEANLLRADKVAQDENVEITSQVLVGKPFAKIIEHIEETQPTLLVMGRYGAHHIDGADMGSNSENLMRLAPCSVLMVGAVEAKPYDVPVLDEYEEQPLEWDADAIKLVLRAPPFAQGMAKAAVEEFARKQGYEQVTLEILNSVLKDMLPPSTRHLMGLEQDIDRKISDARKFARSPIEEFSPHETIFKWTDEARARLNERVPVFIRPIAMLAMERYAREKGMDTVTVEVMIEVSKRLGYAQEDARSPLDTAAAATTKENVQVTWTPEGEERLKRVPPFEREMVRKMVESMAKADGFTEITFNVADMMLKKIKEFYSAQSKGASGFFAGMTGKEEKGEGESAGNEGN
ncbi:MAG: universal stress protein [Chloroflexi bacterium]|nr:universal stress protein [Chloroflexota bacterium]